MSNILTFAACETRRCVDVPIMNDTDDEPDEMFGITLERTPGLNDRITLDPVDRVVTINGDSGMSDFLATVVLESAQPLRKLIVLVCIFNQGILQF